MAVKLKPLADQVIVITGASSGIGLATARKAAQAGAAVVLASRNEDVLRAVCKEINEAGGRAHPVAGDVGSPQDVEKIARAAIARFEHFDTWINDAGVGLYGELMETSAADHERLFRTNYFGVVNGSLEAVKHFRRRGGAGAIINIGSVQSDVASPMMGAYSASKHAVKGFTDALRIELAREKAAVSVTLVKPSSISTPFADHARNLTGKAATLPPPHYAPEVVADAILHAAEHPTRDIEVGAGARPFAIASAAAPGFSDKLLGAVMPPLSRRRGAKPLGDNLYQPGVDGQTEGAHLRGRRFSLYTEAQKRPGLTLGLGALALTALTAFLARDAIGRNARPIIVRTVRPLFVKAGLSHPVVTAGLAVKHPRKAARLASALR